MELQKENDINAEDSFLDLGIKIRDNRFSVNVYGKRDDFLFSFVRMLFYIAIFLLRFDNGYDTSTESTCNAFRTFSKAFLNNAQNQGGNTLVFEITF